MVLSEKFPISKLFSNCTATEKVEEPDYFFGFINPLQWQWLRWGVHPWFDEECEESKGMREQLEAEYRGL